MIAGAIVIAGIALYLRACIPQLWGPYLPAAVTHRITEDHTVCIGTDEVPIWPGEPRQAQCGSVTIKILGEGIVRSEQHASGVSKAICYELVVENPYWETLGQTRHEILLSTRTSYKVALLQDGNWNVFPDDDVQDRSRWLLYSCPAPAY